MRNSFSFHYSGLSSESTNRQSRHELEDIRNEEGSLSTFSTIERGINQKLRSENAGTEYPHEKMMSAFIGKNKYYQRTTRDKAVKFPQKVSMFF